MPVAKRQRKVEPAHHVMAWFSLRRIKLTDSFDKKLDWARAVLSLELKSKLNN